MADTLKVAFTESTNTSEYDTVPANVDSTKTILSIIICNTHATQDATFDMYYYGVGTEDGSTSTGNFRLYNEQSLPAESTFIHDSKIIINANEELKFKQTGTAANPVHVITSYLDQTS